MKKQHDGVSQFLQRAEMEIHQRGLFSRGQKILAAVSGGADSMVLLHTLHLLAGQNRWKISVAHFNHQLRGRASHADEKLVRQTAQKLKVPFYVERAEVKKFAAQSKISIEMAARKLRHEFFARVARKQKITAVALAHHADDQVELFFLRLLRGAGGEGLAGMKWRSPSPATDLNTGRAKLPLGAFFPAGTEGDEANEDALFSSLASVKNSSFEHKAERQLRPTNQEVWLVRPLLGFSKAEILGFARENKIKFRDDTSNFSNDFLRNRIRNELLPLLKKNYQPGLTKSVLRLMEIVGAESEFVSDVAQQWPSMIGRRRGDESQIKIGDRRSAIGNQSETPHVVSCKGFENLSVAVQRKILQQQLVEAGIAADFELVEQLRKSVETFVSVGLGFTVARDVAGKIILQRQSVVENFNTDELKLSGRAGRAEFGGKKFSWLVKKYSGSRGRPSHQPATEFFDADKIGDEIILRHWRAGDRFQPIGLRAAVKLQDLFVNAKIPAAKRRGLVLATTAAGEIFWVEGLRIGEQFKLTPETQRQLVWRF